MVKLIKKKQEGGLLDSIYSKYPTLKNLGNVTLKADTAFTRGKTGVGDIEYFSPKQDTVTYDNNFKVPHPKLGTHGIVYNPTTNNEQDIILDMLHGMKNSDSTYSKLRGNVSDAYKKSKFYGDFEEEYKDKQGDAGSSDGKEQGWNNWIDGQIRGLLFEGTDEDFLKHKYWKDARNTYLKDPSINSTFGALKNYIQTGKPKLKNGGKLVKKYQGGKAIQLEEKPTPKRDWLVDWTKKNFPKLSAVGEVIGGVSGGINPVRVAQFAGDLTGLPGLVNAVGGNPMNLPTEEVRAAILPMIGKASQLTMGLEGAIKPKNSRVLYHMIRNEPKRNLTEKEVEFLQDELNNKGVLDQQKTSNFPGKSKVTNVMTNAVEPFGYNIKGTLKNIKDYVLYPETREAITNNIQRNNVWLGGRNRLATSNTYFGTAPTPGTQPFEISRLSTNKHPIYSIKESNMQINPDYLGSGPSVTERFEELTNLLQEKNINEYVGKAVTPGYEKRIQDVDNYAEIQNGFGWDIRKLPSGNIEFLGTDVWDLNPGQTFKKSKSKLLRKLSPILGKIEAGSTLGIGKPMDIRTGFEWNPVEKAIVRHFKKGGKNINNLKLKNK